MSPWLLCDLVDNLPADAALWRDIDPNARWSDEAVFLGLLVKQTATANWQRGGGKGTRPEVRLPWDVADGDAEHIGLTAFDTVADFDAWRAEQLNE